MPQQPVNTQQTIPPIAPTNPNEIAKYDSLIAAILALTIFSVLSLNALTGLVRVILVAIDRHPPTSR